MLTGTFVTAAGFVPIGFARERGGRIHVLDLRRCDHRADRFLVRRRAVCAFARRGAPREAEAAVSAEPGAVLRTSAASSSAR